MARWSCCTAKLFDLVGQALNGALATLLLLGIGRLPQDNALPVQAGFQGFDGCGHLISFQKDRFRHGSIVSGLYPRRQQDQQKFF